jgi:hypothetical protein
MRTVFRAEWNGRKKIEAEEKKENEEHIGTPKESQGGWERRRGRVVDGVESQPQRVCVCLGEGKTGGRRREGVLERIFDDVLASRHQARDLD